MPSRLKRRSRKSAFAYLASRSWFGVKFGLETIRLVLESLGHPERAYPTLLVAGTNGKGSVVAYADAALRAAGLRTGRYTSPHLVRVNERIAVDGRLGTDQELAHAVGRVRAAAEGLVRARRARAPHLLRGLDRGRPRSLPPASRGRRGPRGRDGRTARRHERRRPPRLRDREHRLRPPGLPRRDAPGDRHREGGSPARGADHGPRAAPRRGPPRHRLSRARRGRPPRGRPSAAYERARRTEGST